MCRLFGFRGKHPSKLSFFLINASNSLAKQAEIDGRNISNHDGWGIGFYQYDRAFIQKRCCNAFEDFNFQMLTEFIHTDTMIAHVRDATVGHLSDYNTHPFMHGRWIFAHNGTIDSFNKLKPAIMEEIGHKLALDIKGTCDSETLFYLFLAKLQKKVEDIDNLNIDLNLLKNTLMETLEWLNNLRKTVNSNTEHKMNVLLTNGEVMLASKYGNSLFYTERKEPLKGEDLTLYNKDLNLNLNIEGPIGNESVIFASEKIDAFDKWVEIPDKTVLTVSIDLTVSLYPMGEKVHK